MELIEMKKAYETYNEELDCRKNLIKAILTNDKNYLDYQQKYIDSYDNTNIELYPILGSLSDEEIRKYLDQSMFNSEYKELTNFFLLLHGYNQLKTNSNNAQKFNEYKSSLYFEFLKWYFPIHGIGSKEKEEVINEFTETTVESISIRNELANRKELNTVFDNILFTDDFERKLAISCFISEVDLFLMFINMYIIKNGIQNTNNSIPKSLILRLVLMNVLTKEYQLGFRIEEYITRFYQTYDIGKHFFDEKVKINQKVLNDYIEEYLMEINDITNEYMNYKEKRKTI